MAASAASGGGFFYAQTPVTLQYSLKKALPMVKKTLFALLFSAALSNGADGIPLDDGSTLFLKSDGSYEIHRVVEIDGKKILLIGEGRWEPYTKKLKPEQKRSIKKSPSASSLAKLLVGRWESRDGSFVYEFREDGTARIKRSNRWVESGYIVEDVDKERRSVVVNIGENRRFGFLSVGGEQKVLRIDEDNKTMHDESFKLKHLRDLVLIKSR